MSSIETTSEKRNKLTLKELRMLAVAQKTLGVDDLRVAITIIRHRIESLRPNTIIEKLNVSQLLLLLKIAENGQHYNIRHLISHEKSVIGQLIGKEYLRPRGGKTVMVLTEKSRETLRRVYQRMVCQKKHMHVD